MKDFGDAQAQSTAKKALKMAQKAPKTFEDCLERARRKFHSYFVNKILQLLHVYPLDSMTKDNRPFWSLPKRAPQLIEFDPYDELHASFVASYACLFANLHKLNIATSAAKFLDSTVNPRSKESKLKMALHVASMEVKDFVPDDQKAAEIQKSVNKESNKNAQEDEAEEEQGSSLIDD